MYAGWGPNVTGAVLGVVFFGVYFGSSFAARRIIMNNVEDPQPPKYFREIRIVTEEKS